MLRRFVLILAGGMALFSAAARAQSWEERLWRQVHKKVAFEFVDTKLTDACDFLSTLTGVNIIIAPAVRQKNPSFSLRVESMDAGTALKWFTELTDTYAELKDQAIYITDKPTEDPVEEEKDAFMRAAAERNMLVELPPKGIRLTNEERVKLLLQLLEKDEPKVQDFPGPRVGLDLEKGMGIKFEKP